MTGGILTGKPVVPADFILLINSAAESIYAKEMRDMMTATLSFDTARKCYQAPDDSGCYLKDEPRIISVTSETDWRPVSRSRLARIFLELENFIAITMAPKPVGRG